MNAVWAVVVAAGRGSRFGGAKQYEDLGGTRVLDWSLAAARSAADGVVLVVAPERAGDADLTKLRFAERLDKRAITALFARADALLIHLADDPLFAITIPSKTQYYLAMGRPIVAGISGDGADLLRESGAAMVVPPGDSASLARAICALADMPAGERHALGASGQAYYRERLSFDRGVEETLALLRGTHQREPRTGPATTS